MWGWDWEGLLLLLAAKVLGKMLGKTLGKMLRTVLCCLLLRASALLQGSA